MTVRIGPVAHGGHCIAHHGQRTLLVRHALPGELAVVRVTQVRSKVVRADAIDIVEPSPNRVEPSCAWSGPGRCGGCDFQHASPSAQRELKAQVVRDSLRRFARLDVDVVVEAVEPKDLGWRTRVDWHADDRGNWGLYAARSTKVVPVDRCPIAVDAINNWRRQARAEPGDSTAHVAVGDDDELAEVRDGRFVVGPRRLRHRVASREWRVGASGFWQVHPAAGRTLVDAVMAVAEVRVGQSWWDLYAGAGLFSAFLAEGVGPNGSVQAVESHPTAVRDARRALHDLPQVRLHERAVADWLDSQAPSGAPDGVVLDPPRSGAGLRVVDRLAAIGAPRLVYVACDPVALARDLSQLTAAGYRLEGLRAFDLFPMTHHIECVASITSAV